MLANLGPSELKTRLPLHELMLPNNDVMCVCHILEVARVIFPKRGQYLTFLQSRLIFEGSHTMVNIGLYFQTCARLPRGGQVNLIENYLPYILN